MSTSGRVAPVGGIRVANAPCSWGTIEGFGETVPWHRMLDELTAAGFIGTELGDLGYMPRDPDVLRTELKRRGLVMLGGFEGMPLRRPGVVAERRERILAVAGHLSALADTQGAGRPPYFILADETRGDPRRTEIAGRVTAADGLGRDEFAVLTRNAEEVARLVEGETGLRTLFHHHCAAFVETPDEIARFLDGTRAGLVDLVFDTGHYTYGCGVHDEPVEGHGKGSLALDGLRRFWDRVPYVHLKDCHPGIAQTCRTRGLSYTEAIAAGVFCELGEGSVDLEGILSFLMAEGYDDWLTVEQDVIPGMGTPAESALRNRETLGRLGL
ncbi:MAG TPA: TIM barrel protein [Trueperaceae bacterium]